MIALVVAALLAQTPELEAQAHSIGMVLRCPVCQGMPIAESPSDMAQAMMGRTRELLAEGKTRQEVLDYFTARYGDWVLLEPRTSGVNLLLWILPAVALLVGFVVLRGYSKRVAPTQRAAASAQAGDAYVDAVRREVDE
jgi:cytochrome c-type biogenesis protein CcmH